jgi:hypothetical protein
MNDAPSPETEEERPDPVVVARDTMVGDLRDCMLDLLRNNTSSLPWNMLPEAQQRATIEKVTKAAEHAVERAVHIIATDGRTALVGELVKIQVKDGIQVQINLSKHDPLRHDLIDAQGKAVLLVVSDADDYGGARAPVKVEPDQKSILDGKDGDLSSQFE